MAICLRFSETNLILDNWFCWLDHVTPLFGLEIWSFFPCFPPNKILFYPYRPWHFFFFFHIQGWKLIWVLLVFFLNVLLPSFIFLWKMKILCLPSLQEDWQIVAFIHCCCGVVRHALYSWRLSNKLFTSQYIHKVDHIRGVEALPCSLCHCR